MKKTLTFIVNALWRHCDTFVIYLVIASLDLGLWKTNLLFIIANTGLIISKLYEKRRERLDAAEAKALRDANTISPDNITYDGLLKLYALQGILPTMIADFEKKLGIITANSDNPCASTEPR